MVRVRLSEAQRGGFGGGPASAETLTLTASATTRQRHIASSERFSVRLEATKIRLRNFYEVPSRRHGFANFDERSSIASSSPLLLASLAVWFGELRSPHASCGFSTNDLRSLRRLHSCSLRSRSGSANFVRLTRLAVLLRSGSNFVRSAGTFPARLAARFARRSSGRRLSGLRPLRALRHFTPPCPQARCLAFVASLASATAEALALLASPFVFARSLRSRSCSPGFARLARFASFLLVPLPAHHYSVQAIRMFTRGPRVA